MEPRPTGKTTKWLLVGLVAVVGAYSAYWVARPAGWSTTGTVVFVAAVTVALVWAIGGAVGVVPILLYRRVAREGVQSPATIIEAWRTENTTQDQGEVRSEVKLLVEMTSPSGERYRVRTKTTATTEEEAWYQPGATVDVRYHPNFPRKVFVTSGGPDAAQGGYSSPSK